MRWLEIIELRSAGDLTELIGSELRTLVGDAFRDEWDCNLRVYRIAGVGTDLRIHLLRDSGRAEQAGSPLGLQLASSLKEFGLVNHSVWLDATEPPHSTKKHQ